MTPVRSFVLQWRKRLAALDRGRVLAAAALGMALLLPLSMPRDHIQLERRGQTWTVRIDGVEKARVLESGPPFPVARAGLFLSGPRGAQRWSDVSLRAGENRETRWFPRDGLGIWSGEPRWTVDLLGARPSLAGESIFQRPFPAAGDFTMDATMIAGSEGGAVVQDDGGTSRVRLWMRPARHNDAVLALSEPGHPTQSANAGPVGLEWPNGLRGVLLGTLGPAVLAAMAALVLRAIQRRRGRAHLPGVTVGAARVVVAAVAVAVLVATSFIERSVFEGMPHVQDSVALIFQARNFALGRWASPSAFEPRFFDHEFVINNGLWFGKYPPGASLLYALGLLTHGLDWVNPALAAGSILLLFQLGRRVYGTAEGLIAVFLAGSSPFLLLVTASYLSHPTALFFSLCFLLASVGPARPGRYGVAGLSLGALILTRPQTAAALALPFLVTSSRRFLRSSAKRRALLAFAVGILPAVIGFLAYDAALTGSIWRTPFQLYSPYDRLGFGAVGVEWPGDFHLGKALINLRTNLDALVRSVSAAGSALLILAFVPLMKGGEGRRARLLALPSLAIVCLFFFYFHDGVFLGPRYWYEATPALFILAARGITSTARGLAALVPTARSRTGLSAALCASLVAALVLPTLGKARREIPGLRGLNGIDGRLLRAAAGIEGDAVVFVESRNSWQPYGSVFWTLWPDLEKNRVIYAREGGIYNVHPDSPPLAEEVLTGRFPDRAVYHWNKGRLVRSASSPLDAVPND